MNTLEYLSIDKQIEKLKSQHLNFEDENRAKTLLMTHGYYNIIHGYREPYIFINDNGKKQYLDGVTFEQIYNLFVFDLTIRDSIMISMIDMEDHLKAIVSDIIGSSFGIDYQQYLDRNNYRDKYVSNPKFSRNEILYTLTKSAMYSKKEPIKHYREKYNNVPPWILFKDTYFATLVNLIRCFKKSERDILVKRLYGNKITSENIDSYKDFMSDTLFMCLDYRNRTAHGGRIYNYIPGSTLRPFMNITPQRGLPQLVFALEKLMYDIPFNHINESLKRATNIYCNTYPSEDDINRLGNAIGFKITSREVVWINETTKIYHNEKHCSGSHSLKSISLDTALSKGYIPCKKCCNDEN